MDDILEIMLPVLAVIAAQQPIDPVCVLRPVPVSPENFEVVTPSLGRVRVKIQPNGITDPSKIRVAVSWMTDSLVTNASTANLIEGLFSFQLPTPPLQNGQVSYSTQATGNNCLGTESPVATFIVVN